MVLKLRHAWACMVRVQIPMAEFSEWFWGGITNMTWYEKGVLWRERMVEAGYVGDEAWFVDEFGDDVRQSGLNQTVSEISAIAGKRAYS
jgi:hypothetical protein